MMDRNEFDRNWLDPRHLEASNNGATLTGNPWCATHHQSLKTVGRTQWGNQGHDKLGFRIGKIGRAHV